LSIDVISNFLSSTGHHLMATVIAFTSGKGGVGKTNIATNLGLALSSRSEKVCLFDADTGLANINILMGITPELTIEHVLKGEKSIEDIILKLPSGISIIPAASGIQQCTDLDSQQIQRLTTSLVTLEKNFDYILIDTAAGIDSNVLDFVASAQYRIIVITPEPTSLTDSFALLKMLIIRGKKKAIFVLVNQVKDYPSSQAIFKRFQQAVKSFLKIDIYFLGYLTTDKYLNKAVSQQIPVVLAYPASPVSCGIASLADIIKRQFRNDKHQPFFSQYWATLYAQQNKQLPPPSESPHYKPVSSKHVPPPLSDVNQLSEFYQQLAQQNLSKQQLKELALTIETLFEKKYQQPLKDINSLVALILAEADANKIQQLYTSIEQSFERQFNRSINDPLADIETILTSDKLNKADFIHIMARFSAIYQQRFNEKYFAESHQLLTTIQQLLVTKK